MLGSCLICLAISTCLLYAKSNLLGNFQISIHAFYLSCMSKILECINTKEIYIYIYIYALSAYTFAHKMCHIKVSKTLMLPMRTKEENMSNWSLRQAFIWGDKIEDLHYFLIVCNSHMLLSCNFSFHIGTLNQGFLYGDKINIIFMQI
jgi:hypothetical protein